MVRQILLETLRSAVCDVAGVCPSNLTLEHPSNPKWGDYASSVALTLSKDLKQNPMEIAKKICYRMNEIAPRFQVGGNEYSILGSVKVAVPGFINIELSEKWLQNALQTSSLYSDNYKLVENPQNQKILVEYSQPNPNKPMHVGHARNNFLGNSISKILRALGNEIIEANYINDWGVHICKSMLMYQKYGGSAEPDIKPDHFVGNFYIRFEQEAEEHPELITEAQELLRKLESNDNETKNLWEKIVKWTYKGWEKTYSDQLIKFDLWQYQSDYRHSGKEVAMLAVERGIAEHDETGAVVARLEKYGIPDKVLLRSDGTSIYSTQDLQLAKDSFEKHKLDQRLYVVDYRQSDYFRQIFKILEILGFEWASRLHHVSYGTVSLPEGKMSSRTGLVVNADDVYERLIEIETEEMKRRLGASEKDSGASIDIETVRKVAMAAFKYALLKVDPKQNIVFDYNQVTKFEGDTGPYLLYTFARANSVLERAKSSGISQTTVPDFTLDSLSNSELSILKLANSFPEIVEDAGAQKSPSILCNYLQELAATFNTFYAESPVINADTEMLKSQRVMFTMAVHKILGLGLSLLGIEAPLRM